MRANCFRFDPKTKNVSVGTHSGPTRKVWENMDNCVGAHEITDYSDFGYFDPEEEEQVA